MKHTRCHVRDWVLLLRSFPAPFWWHISFSLYQHDTIGGSIATIFRSGSQRQNNLYSKIRLRICLLLLVLRMIRLTSSSHMALSVLTLEDDKLFCLRGKG